MKLKKVYHMGIPVDDIDRARGLLRRRIKNRVKEPFISGSLAHLNS